jgi:hypothetical protein
LPPEEAITVPKIEREFRPDVPVSELQFFPGNARRGDAAAIDESIQTNGFYKPIIVQKSTGFVVAGNNSLERAIQNGVETVDVYYIDVDDVTAKRINAVDNGTNDTATYDFRALESLLEGIRIEQGDLRGTGFTDDLLAGITQKAEVARSTDISFVDAILGQNEEQHQADEDSTVTTAPAAPPPGEVPGSIPVEPWVKAGFLLLAPDRNKLVAKLNEIKKAKNLPTLSEALLHLTGIRQDDSNQTIPNVQP